MGGWEGPRGGGGGWESDVVRVDFGEHLFTNFSVLQVPLVIVLTESLRAGARASSYIYNAFKVFKCQAFA